jgi:hypothetical protein
MARAEPKMIRPRTLLLLVATPLLLLALLGVAILWRLDRQVHQAGDELVAEVRAFSSVQPIRPPHTDTPAPGTFAEGIGPLMPELIRLFKAEPQLTEQSRELCKDVRDGKRPLSALPSQCREALERGRTLLPRALLAARAERAGLPEGLRALDDPTHPNQDRGMISLVHIARLAALESRLQLEEGRPDTAVELCVDALAFSRDLGHGGGLIAAMVSVAGHDMLFLPCANALDRASPASREQAAVRLRRIREGLSPLSQAMRAERLYMPLALFGSVLEPDQLGALPPGAKAIISHHGIATWPDGPALLSPFLMQHALLEMLPLYRQIEAAVDLPPSARAARLDTVRLAAMGSWNPIVQESITDFGTYAARVDRQRAQMDLLLALALVKSSRAAGGAWPTALPALFPEREVLHPTALRLREDESGRLLLVPVNADLEELALRATP